MLQNGRCWGSLTPRTSALERRLRRLQCSPESGQESFQAAAPRAAGDPCPGKPAHPAAEPLLSAPQEGERHNLLQKQTVPARDSSALRSCFRGPGSAAG